MEKKKMGMKVVLSRKGFDSSNGGMASPIFPDGTMLSMPIPSNDKVKYSELIYNNKKYSEIIGELNPRFTYKTCHLDPDIRHNVRIFENEEWRPAFGQIGASGTILKNNIAVDDLILFFGWFRFVEECDGKWRFVRRDKNKSFYSYADLQVIYGYMQVGKILTVEEDIKEYSWHPHSSDDRIHKKTNILITPSERLSFNPALPGYGTLDFREDRVLTKEGFSRGIWEEHSFLLPYNLVIPRKNCSAKGIYYSGIWQELLLKDNAELDRWVDTILKD